MMAIYSLYLFSPIKYCYMTIPGRGELEKILQLSHRRGLGFQRPQRRLHLVQPAKSIVGGACRASKVDPEGLQFINPCQDRGTEHLMGKLSLGPTGLPHPFKTPVPFWSQTTLTPSALSPQRDCDSNRINQYPTPSTGETGKCSGRQDIYRSTCPQPRGSTVGVPTVKYLSFSVRHGRGNSRFL